MNRLISSAMVIMGIISTSPCAFAKTPTPTPTANQCVSGIQRIIHAVDVANQSAPSTLYCAADTGYFAATLSSTVPFSKEAYKEDYKGVLINIDGLKALNGTVLTLSNYQSLPANIKITYFMPKNTKYSAVESKISATILKDYGIKTEGHRIALIVTTDGKVEGA